MNHEIDYKNQINNGDDYYLDNIFMYGKQASDILRTYCIIPARLRDITHQDYPENIMNYISTNCRTFYAANSNGYLKKRLVQTAKKSKFPLWLFLLLVLAGYLIIHFLAYISNGFITDGILIELCLLFGSCLVIGIPLGIVLLVRGAVIRDSYEYKYMQRAYSSDVYLLDNQIAVVTHAYDYPNYEKRINPIGQFMTKDVLNSFYAFWSQPGFKTVNEMLQFEKYYDDKKDREFPFNQCFVIDRIYNCQQYEGYKKVIADCHIYTVSRRPVGNYLRYDTNDNRYNRTLITKFHFYYYDYKTRINVLIPDQDDRLMQKIYQLQVMG